MPLETYQRKRDFTITPEPAAHAVRSDPWALTFAAHARGGPRPRFELRLEHEGVLLSWVVAHGPSLDPELRRVAVRVEDHPVAYARFEGLVPPTAWGGGPVQLWDRGRWVAESDVEHGLAVGRLVFALHGERLRGSWRLVRIGRTEWALGKRDDEHARAGDGAGIVRRHRASVSSGRTLGDISEADGAADLPTLVEADPLLSEAGAVRDESPWGLRLPAVDPAGEPGAGVRVYARKEGGRVLLATRSGIDCTAAYPTIAAALAVVPLAAFLLDGEVAPVGAHPSRIAWSEPGAGVELRAIDLLSAGTADLRGVAERRRWELLHELFGGSASVVRGGRREDFVVVGFTAGSGSTLSSLLVAQPEGGGLSYRGRVRAGFGAVDRSVLRQILEPLVIDAPVVAGAPRVPGRNRVRWLDPQVRVEVAYAARTATGLERASFVGLLVDGPRTARWASRAAEDDRKVA